MPLRGICITFSTVKLDIVTYFYSLETKSYSLSTKLYSLETKSYFSSTKAYFSSDKPIVPLPDSRIKNTHHSGSKNTAHIEIEMLYSSVE
ncbi:hypothetical protein Barb4_04754 [Bacteroidales bacterium Barb4]|nr:hypothetical protein Barb4_04754 [Bacteroidales bacterium Barb4]